MVTNLHLLFNQILGLDKSAHKLFSFFALQMTNLVLVDDIGDFELFLFCLQLMLLVNELLAKDSFLVVEVEEHAQVLCQLIVLLRLDDALDLSLLGYLLPNQIDLFVFLFVLLLKVGLLLLSKVLCLDMLLLPKLLFQK